MEFLARGSLEQVFDALFFAQQHDAHVKAWKRHRWLIEARADSKACAEHVASVTRDLIAKGG
jgi:hypothetical protein